MTGPEFETQAYGDSDDSKLDRLLSRWTELREQGQDVSAQEVCSTCPELADELAQRIETLRRLEPVLPSTDLGTFNADVVLAPVASRQAAIARAEFHNLRYHAAGGLGEVYLAHNSELNRDVALKFVKPDRSHDPDSLRRFLQEAEVTGRLEHPGVVPIYALGTDTHGSPCYAMRFIHGETLQDAIDAFHEAESPGREPTERSLALRELLNRFVSICSTVAYAHSRGILHRDLKPQNVMLGKYDETLVVDWGLAKPISQTAADATSSGEERLMPSSGSGSDTPTIGVVGTLAYMSPEQAKARWDIVGPASDIFSLGAIFYAILTGRAPYQGKALGEIYERVERCQFPEPRQLRSRVPRALEAICLKAMAATPEGRYATAIDLASDVRRWLADEPVLAYREPLPTRAWRGVRAHKTLVAACLALLVSAVVGLAINDQIVRQERDLAERARDRALAAEGRAVQARNDAEAARQQETTARALADANSAFARKAVDDMFIYVAEDRFTRVPGVVLMRKEIVQRALAYYRDFLKLRPHDREVRRQTALILERLANIERMTNGVDSAFGHYAEAETLYKKLFEEFPSDETVGDGLAALERDFAEALRMNWRLKEACPLFAEALRLARVRHDAKADDPDRRRTLASILSDYGVALSLADRLAEGLPRCDEAVALFAGLNRMEPLHNPQLDPLLLLMSLVERAPLQRDARMADHALRALEEAEQIARNRLAMRAHAGDPNFQYYLAAALCERGLILLEMTGKLKDAEKAFRESEGLLATLRKNYTAITFYPPKHAEALSGRGAALAALGSLGEAEAECRAAQALLEPVVQKSPRDASAACLLARTLSRRANIAWQRNDRDAAKKLWDDAIARCELIVKQPGGNPRAAKLLERIRDERKHEAGPAQDAPSSPP
jgi:eukaryotic-like serine/threonine-protein kinase